MMNDEQTVKDFSTKELKLSLNDKVSQLIIYPTEQCNFRCVYCYEDFEIGKMPNWVVDAIKQFIQTKIPSTKILSLSWFGGEPLLAKDIIFEITEHAQRLAKQYNCTVTGNLTTNGLLLDVKTLQRLVELKQNSFQISIDGDQESHDKTRITQSGRGTFNKIWDRLIAASQTDLEFNILLRVHVTDLNQENVLKFCQMYDKELKHDSRFKLFFKAIENLGGKNTNKINLLISQRTAKELVKELTLKYSKTKNKTEHNYICYASKPNSLAIRANGSLNKCTVALSDERNNIGKINPDGTLTVNNQKFSTWIKGFTTLDSWQMGCPLSYMNNNSTVGDIQVKKVG